MDIDGIVMLTERDEAFFHEMLVHVPLGVRFGISSESDIKEMRISSAPEISTTSGKRVLVIGGGDGGTVRELVKYPEIREIVVCDYDERVVKRSREFFSKLASSFDDARVRLHFEDAVAFIAELPDGSFDHVVIDGNGPFPEMEGVLFSETFYRQVERVLAPDGTASTFAGTPVSDYQTYAMIISTLRKIFAYAEPYLSYVPMYDTGCWGNLLLAKTPPSGRFRELPPSQGAYRYMADGVREAAFVLPAFARVPKVP